MILIVAFLLINLSGKEGGLGSSGVVTGFLLLCIASSLMIPMENKNKVIKQTLTSSKCDKCSQLVISDYKDGDFVFKNSGKCPNCDGNLKVIEIYSVKLKPQKEKIKSSAEKSAHAKLE